MMGSATMAAVLLLLLGGALVLAWLAVRTAHRRARMHARSMAVVDTTRFAKAGEMVRREADPLLGAKRQSAADAWLLRALPAAQTLDERVAEAGFSGSLFRFLGISLAVAAGVCAGLMLWGVAVPVALAIACMLTLFGVHMILKYRIASRCKRFERLLPEALGLMVRGLRAGVPVSETVAEVGREIIDPVGEAFRRAHQQVRLGQPLEAALLAETRAMASPAMNFLIVTLSVQRETGGNLAETLDKLDDIMRRREQMQLKIKAMSSEAKASAFIIGSLPILMGALMAVIAPEYILPLFSTTAGHVLLGGAILSLGIGGWLMAQLVAFDI